MYFHISFSCIATVFLKSWPVSICGASSVWKMFLPCYFCHDTNKILPCALPHHSSSLCSHCIPWYILYWDIYCNMVRFVVDILKQNCIHSESGSRTFFFFPHNYCKKIITIEDSELSLSDNFLANLKRK